MTSAPLLPSSFTSATSASSTGLPSILLRARDFDLLPPPQLTAWLYAHLHRPVNANHLHPFGLELLSSSTPPHPANGVHPSGDDEKVAHSGRSPAALFSLSPSSCVSVVYASTRLLLLVDLSPSISIVDPTTTKPLYSGVLDSLALLLRHLSTSPLLRSSTLHLSIVGHNPASSTPLYVLLHCAVLHSANVEAILETVAQRTMDVENHQAEEQQQQQQQQQQHAADFPIPLPQPARAVEEEAEDDGSLGQSGRVSGDEFHQLLQQSLFFLDRLPACAAPSLLLLTDAVLPLSSSLSSHGSMLALLLRRAIPLSLLQLTPASTASSFSFGYVPDTEIVRYATRVTGGLFAGQETFAAITDREHGGWSALERSVFVRDAMVRGWRAVQFPTGVLHSLVRHKSRPAMLSSSTTRSSPFADLLTAASYRSPSEESAAMNSTPSHQPAGALGLAESDWAALLLRERVKRYTMATDVLRLLECRHREGFHAFVHRAEGRVELLMRKEWRPGVHIEYQAELDSPAESVWSTDVELHGKPGKSLSLKRFGSLGTSAAREIKASIFIVAQRGVLDALCTYKAQLEELQEKTGAHRSIQEESRRGVGVSEQARSLWTYLAGMQQADVLMVHLSKVALDAIEQRFTHAKSDVMLLKSTSIFPFSPPPYAPPSLPLSSSVSPAPELEPPSIVLPALPPFLASSYLSPSHPLWHQLAAFPLSALRRFFVLSSFSILSSMHRTSQLSEGVELELELELEIDFASLARVKKQEEGETLSSSFARELSIARGAGGLDARKASEAASGTQTPSQSAGRSGMGQQDVAETLCRLLQGWSSVTVSNACFVFFPPPPLYSADDSSVSTSALSAAYADMAGSSVPFALLRLTWRTKFLSTLTIAFHGCDPATRSSILHSLQAVISSTEMRVNPTINDIDDADSSKPPPPVPEPLEEKEEEPLQLGRAFSARSTLSSQFSQHSRTTSTMSEDSGSVELVHPFGIVQQPLDALIIRPSYVLSSCVSSPMFYTLFPQNAATSSTSTSQFVLSYSVCQQQLRLLRSYMRYHTWTWELASSVSMKTATKLLRGARAEEGFVLVASTIKGSVWVREVQLVQPAENEAVHDGEDERRMEAVAVHQQLNSPSSPPRPSILRSASTPALHEQRLMHGHRGVTQPRSLPHAQSLTSAAMTPIPPSTSPPTPSGRPSSCLVQCSVTEVDATHVQTELWMEPFYGLYHFVLPAPPSSPPSSYHSLTSEQLFVHLASWMHSTDLHLLSALCTFDSVRDLELELDIGAHMQSRAGAEEGGGSGVQGESSGLQLRLFDDFHAQPTFDYDHDSQQRMLTRFFPDTCHPTLLLQIATVNRVLGLLRFGSHSAMYATLGAHGGSLADLHTLGDRRLSSANFASGGQHGSGGVEEWPRMKRGSSAASLAHSEDEDDEKTQRALAVSPSVLLSSPRRSAFTLTSPVSVAIRSHRPLSPLASPSLSALPSPTVSSQLWERRRDSGQAHEARDSSSARKRAPTSRRERHKRELVPFSLTFLLECSTPSALTLPLPSIISSPPSRRGPVNELAQTAPITQPAPSASSSGTAGLPPLPASRRSSGSTHSHSLSTSSLPTVNPPLFSSTVGNLPSGSRSTTVSPAHRAWRKDADGTLAGSPDGVRAPASLSTAAMLLLAVRRLSDVELIKDRCFAQLVNEYTIVVIVLPSASSARPHSDEADGLRLRRWRSTEAQASAKDDEERRREDKERELHAYLDALLALECGGGEAGPNELRAVLFDCNRDEFAHPWAIWPESDGDLPPSASMASFSSFASASSSSRSEISRSDLSTGTPSPATSPPHTPSRPESPAPALVPTLPAYVLTDGRSARQLAAQKAALMLLRVRLQALRFLLSSPPLQLVRPALSESIHWALSLAQGTAAVSYAPPSPVGAELTSPSPMLKPLTSPEAKRERSTGNILTSPVVQPISGFQLDETLDEADIANQQSTRDDQREEEKAAAQVKDDVEDAGLLTTSESGWSADAPTPRPPSPRAESPPPPSPAAVFAHRVMAAHMRNYCKAVYAALRSPGAVVPLDDVHVALGQCVEYEEALDLSAIQVDDESSDATTGDATAEAQPTPPSATKALHEALQRLLTSHFQPVPDTDGVYVYVGEFEDEDKADASPPTAPASVLSVLSPHRTPPRTALISGGSPARPTGRPEDADSKGEMRVVRQPLFLQLRASVWPAGSDTVGSTPPLSPTAAPVQIETTVDADTELTRLSSIILRYQRPPWWRESEDATPGASFGGVHCALLIRALALPEYSERSEASQRHWTLRDRDAATATATPSALHTASSSPSPPPQLGRAEPSNLFPRLPHALRVIMLRAYEQVQRAVAICAAAPS